MKQILPIALLAGITILPAASCKFIPGSDEPMTRALCDSLNKAYPKARTVTAGVTNRTELAVLLCDTTLYMATHEQQQREANRIGLMAIRIFSRDGYVQTAALTVTRDTANNDEKPKDGIVIPVNIDSLKSL